jgi:electron transfer flavoprotein alpha subunit
VKAGAVWALAESDAGRVRPVSYELLAWGLDLRDKLRARGGSGPDLCAIVLGSGIDEAGVAEFFERGADSVILVDDPRLEHFVVEPCAGVLEHLVRRYGPQIAIAAATTTGRTLMPYLAVRIPTGLTADCTGLDVDPETGNLIQTRPAAGGNIMATIVTGKHRPQMATVRPRSARAPHRSPGRRGELLRPDVPAALLDGPTRRLGLRRADDDAVNIQECDKLVAGGRGLKRPGNFALVRELADALDAGVAASREAVERGWASYPHQVGLSGKTVTPRLYVALGISGAIQHLAGMRTAECVVAVNSDPAAQMLQVADFAVVGDLFEFVPALAEEIRRRKTEREAP